MLNDPATNTPTLSKCNDALDRCFEDLKRDIKLAHITHDLINNAGAASGTQRNHKHNPDKIQVESGYGETCCNYYKPDFEEHVSVGQYMS